MEDFGGKDPTDGPEGEGEDDGGEKDHSDACALSGEICGASGEGGNNGSEDGECADEGRRPKKKRSFPPDTVDEEGDEAENKERRLLDG